MFVIKSCLIVMCSKSKKINKFPTVLPKKGAFTIETEPDFPKLHTLCIASGKRGGGKSVAVANFVKSCKNRGYYDRVWLITPTYWSNKAIWDIAEIEEEDIHEPSVGVLKEIVALVEAERAEWDLFLQQKEMYKKFQKDIKSKPITRIDPDTLLEYQDVGFFEGPPEWKYKNEVPPRLGVIIDDALGTPLLSKPSAGLVNLCIKHRHIGKGLGISIFMLVQSYCAQGGINRAIRENCTLLMLFKVNQDAQVKKIYEESDLDLTEESFLETCHHCHETPFNFLLMDFSPKDEDKRFRSGWDTYIYPKRKSLERVSEEVAPQEQENLNVGNK
jgi:hypothetical protein